MSIKRILVPLPGSVDHSGEIDMALSAAKALGAYVEAQFINEPPSAARRVMPRAIGYGARMAAVSVSWVAEERDRLALEAHDRWAHECAVSGIPTLADHEEVGALPAASWREVEGSYANLVAQRAAAFDLVVAASSSVLESLKVIAEQSLLQARRPVLLAPAARRETNLMDTAMIAWDESPECWHAVSAAIPFLHVAKSVQVVSIDQDAGRRRASQVEVLTYLRCHGIGATAQVVAPDLRSVGDALLATAGEHTAGLLVMGAYSHSRLREMLLGGATRHILQNASARPILLMH